MATPSVKSVTVEGDSPAPTVTPSVRTSTLEIDAPSPTATPRVRTISLETSPPPSAVSPHIRAFSSEFVLVDPPPTTVLTIPKMRQIEGADTDLEEAFTSAISPSSSNRFMTSYDVPTILDVASGSLVTSSPGTSVLVSMTWPVGTSYLKIDSYHAIPGANDIEVQGYFLITVGSALITGSWVKKDTAGSSNQNYSAVAVSSQSLSPQASISLWSPGSRTITVSVTVGSDADTVNSCFIEAV